MTTRPQQQPVLDLSDLPDPGSVGFETDGVSYFAVRSRGKIWVYRNRCPHRQVRLNWQPDAFFDASGSLIQCATHGALFLIESGECVSGPCQGEYLDAVPFSVDGDKLFLLGAH
ncbi:Rieske 2Fe-2S domain-containing protein [Spongiibacter taiwanensis]|uniref:Rieske (2Fe-2S) protein n=1 Tax=Spongiibacter taiwanensis TaxID=1748242 RepID=UPI0020359F15|nr:Rieske 2Fe-2S domain-containing protein [Spongiibacter taiwanensis]USA44405.1 Rieske 2Fe-2S domain-containing protein [Spongiibacter taiwanensis]